MVAAIGPMAVAPCALSQRGASARAIVLKYSADAKRKMREAEMGLSFVRLAARPGVGPTPATF